MMLVKVKNLLDSSPNKIYEKIYGKKFNIKTDNIGVIRNILNENPNWPKIRDAVTNTSTRVLELETKLLKK